MSERIIKPFRKKHAKRLTKKEKALIAAAVIGAGFGTKKIYDKYNKDIRDAILNYTKKPLNTIDQVREHELMTIKNKEIEELIKQKGKEVERLAKEKKMEAERLEKEKKMKAERLAKEKKMEADRLAKEKKMETERLAKEKKLEADRLAKEKKLEADRLGKEKKQQEEARKKLVEDNIYKLYSELKKSNVSLGEYRQKDACITYNRFLTHLDFGCKYAGNLKECRHRHMKEDKMDINKIKDSLKALDCVTVMAKIN